MDPMMMLPGDPRSDPEASYPIEMLRATPEAPKKHSRVGRPKVRTGCVTCRIRRIKCDEAKPFCDRCTSTGRTCDGYGAGVPRRRNRRGWVPQQPSRQTPNRPRWRVIRPLLEGIEGTEQERGYFHSFRRAAETGFALHVSNLGSGFWQHLIPLVGHSNPAVRHALFALGGAWHMMKLQSQRSAAANVGSGPILPSETMDNFRLDQIRNFTLRQYNKAIASLQRHITSPASPGNIEITLLCCLIFILLETARGNQEATLSHLTNGLHIINTLLPAEILRLSQLSSSFSSSNSSPASMGMMATSEAAVRSLGFFGGKTLMAAPEWKQLLHLFLALELAGVTCTLHAATSTSNRRSASTPMAPLIRLRMRAAIPLDDPSLWDERILTVEQGHLAAMRFEACVYARIWETAPYKGDRVFWGKPERRADLELLFHRGRQVRGKLEEFLVGPLAPSGEGEDRVAYVSALIDLLHAGGLMMAAKCMPYKHTRREAGLLHADILEEMVRMAERIVAVVESLTEVPDVALDNGVMITMDVVMSTACSVDLRRRARRVLSFLGGKAETVYHGDALAGVYDKHGIGGLEELWQEEKEEACSFLDGFVGPISESADSVSALDMKMAAAEIF
ncbi:hypothetical protein F4778DRAFT_728808 [Xylariomycetidae sp. FL2044]|nr:hypothetical protein F4778DRAFT_728808 [Xylariomycetidae sp. FL2044]